MTRENKTRKYKTIPVTPDVYDAVVAIADANHRTQGGQIAHWVQASRAYGWDGVSVGTLPAPDGGVIVPVVHVSDRASCLHAKTAPMMNKSGEKDGRAVCLQCGFVLDSDSRQITSGRSGDEGKDGGGL